MFRCSQFYDVSFNRFSIRSHLFSGKRSHPGQLRCSEMGVAGSDVRPRPRPSPDMVTACCIARKGNFRTGPALNGKMDFLQLPDAFDSSDEDRSLRIPTAAKAKRRVRWHQRLEERVQLVECGEDWTDSRRSEDINFAELPEVGVANVARVRTFHDAGAGAATARQRAARRKGKEGKVEATETTTEHEGLKLSTEDLQ